MPPISNSQKLVYDNSKLRKINVLENPYMSPSSGKCRAGGSPPRTAMRQTGPSTIKSLKNKDIENIHVMFGPALPVQFRRPCLLSNNCSLFLKKKKKKSCPQTGYGGGVRGWCFTHAHLDMVQLFPSCFHFAPCFGIHKFGRLIVSAVCRPGAGHSFNSETATKQPYREIHSHCLKGKHSHIFHCCLILWPWHCT